MENNTDLFHEILSSIKDVIKDLQVDLKEIKYDISEIKLDINHHIMRTDLLQESQDKQEKIVRQLEKDSWKAKGVLAFMAFLLMFAATYQFFKK